jgi:hypothetical protein
MTVHVTISLEDEPLAQARREAQRLGIALETYLSHLVQTNLPAPGPAVQDKLGISAIFGIGASSEPTDVGRDKDAMLGEAAWNEHLRKTRQAS